MTLLVSIAVIGLILVVGSSASFVAAQQEVTAQGQSATAGPWQITLVEVKIGDDAAKLAKDAGDADAPAESGTQYVAAHLTMTNSSTIAFEVQPDDFMTMGNAGIGRRTAAVFMPDPALLGSVAPGATLDGWILSSVESDATSIVLTYDSTTISGSWADHSFAVTDGATLDPATDHVSDPDKDGRDVSEPVGPGRVISTDEWTIKMIDVVTGPDVLDIVPDGTQRLGQNYQNGETNAICLYTWVAIEFHITNNAADGQTRSFSQTAFTLSDTDGNTVPDVRMLSAPIPEVSGDYMAGASRDGWIAFELPSACENGEINLQYTDDLLRFQSFAASSDIRYLSWGDGETAAPEPTDAAIDPDNVFASGTQLVVADDSTVNLRSDPSTSGDVVAQLDPGTGLTVTGDPQSADGYVWYPVTVTDTGEEGWAVADYLVEP